MDGTKYCFCFVFFLLVLLLLRFIFFVLSFFSCLKMDTSGGHLRFLLHIFPSMVTTMGFLIKMASAHMARDAIVFCCLTGLVFVCWASCPVGCDCYYYTFCTLFVQANCIIYYYNYCIMHACCQAYELDQWITYHVIIMLSKILTSQLNEV